MVQETVELIKAPSLGRTSVIGWSMEAAVALGLAVLDGGPGGNAYWGRWGCAILTADGTEDALDPTANDRLLAEAIHGSSLDPNPGAWPCALI